MEDQAAGTEATVAAGRRTVRRRLATLAVLAVSVALAAPLVLMVPGASGQAAATACPAAGCAVTIDAHDFGSGSALSSFNFVVNLDNTKLPSDAQPLSTESN